MQEVVEQPRHQMNDNDGELLRWQHHDPPDEYWVATTYVLGPRFEIKIRYRPEGIRYVVSVNGRPLGETRSLADAKQIAQAHWESL
jgi:hypothetical protein